MSESLAVQPTADERSDDHSAIGQPSVLAQELGVIGALWWRDLLRLKKQRSRWFGVLAQPVLFWLILGSGMASSFTLNGAADVDYTAFFFPGVLVMILLFTTIFATISIIEDRRMGFLQSVLVVPGSRLAMVLGKIAGVTSLALIQTVLFLALIPLAGYSFAGVDWPLLSLVVLLSCVGLTAANLTVAWLIPSVQGYHAIMSVVMIPLWMVSGAMFPVSGGWLAALATINPLSYMVEGCRASLGGAAAATTSASLGLILAVLAGFAVVTVTLSAWVCRRR